MATEIKASPVVSARGVMVSSMGAAAVSLSNPYPMSEQKQKTFEKKAVKL